MTSGYRTLRTVPLLTLLALGALVAAPAGHEIDAVHSAVVFKVGHMGAGNVYGRFNDFTGTFSYDEENPGNSSVAMEVKTASVDTGNQQRDNHLRTADFFDAEKHPTISFKSTKVERVARDVYSVTGDLTLHGTTRPLTVSVVKLGTGGREGEVRQGFETTFTIRRSEFGMDKMIPAAGDRVQLTVGLEGVRK